MSERLPYEKQLSQHWNELPMPDVAMAWADMKRRLDEDDDRPLVPIWLRGCAGWLLLGLIVAGLCWWIVRPEKWFTKNEPEQTKIITQANSKDTAVILTTTGDGPTVINPPPVPPANLPADSSGKASVNKNNLVKKQDGNIGEKIYPKSSTDKEKVQIEQGGGKGTGRKPGPDHHTKRPAKNKSQTYKREKDNKISKPGADSINKTKPPVEPAITKTVYNPDSSIVKTSSNIDTGQKIKAAVPEDSSKQDNNRPKEDNKKKKPFYVSTGLGLHQQLPVDGQNLVPYSSLGRKGSFGDYIPSAYLRLERDNKWFIQTGFRYGAPQLAKELLYSEKHDTISQQKINKTRVRLQKTFYHQIPLGFHYNIFPGFSLGTGITWNKFSKAVSFRELVQTDRSTGRDTVLSPNQLFNTRKADSNFVASYFQASIEAQYKWRRISFGANYSFGLQPYIRFVLQGGQPQEQKINALQLFIRYELWRSKEKE